MKKINLNIHLIELFTIVPKYARLMKEMLANKETYMEERVVTLSTNCSYIIKKDITISEQLKDPGSFTIPCDIRTFH